MTIKELYEWAVKENKEDWKIAVDGFEYPLWWPYLENIEIKEKYDSIVLH